MADAAEIAPTFVGKEDISAEVDGLSKTLEAPASTRQFSQIRSAVYRDEYNRYESACSDLRY